ncbi:MAG: hypothetical protein CO182_04705 [Lysobacterales bacterium CG_4_9_14_3_um_filter_62_6]|nr:MAG: hypothetical protein CO182_04705 [Xanthomonadales bacterium CG_4_9_14_3_um_filter_62_6]
MFGLIAAAAQPHLGDTSGDQEPAATGAATTPLATSVTLAVLATSAVVETAPGESPLPLSGLIDSAATRHHQDPL